MKKQSEGVETRDRARDGERFYPWRDRRRGYLFRDHAADRVRASV